MVITFRFTKAKANVKYRVKHRCGHEGKISSVPINTNTKAKAKTYVWGINFTLISVSTVTNDRKRVLRVICASVRHHILPCMPLPCVCVSLHVSFSDGLSVFLSFVSSLFPICHDLVCPICSVCLVCPVTPVCSVCPVCLSCPSCPVCLSPVTSYVDSPRAVTAKCTKKEPTYYDKFSGGLEESEGVAHWPLLFRKKEAIHLHHLAPVRNSSSKVIRATEQKCWWWIQFPGYWRA